VKKGTLFVVATPIGNLEDISKRAIDTLSAVYVIFAERPNWSKKLLNHLNIHKMVLQYSETTREKGAKRIIDLLNDGKNVALISDAGTPLISDPGASLVQTLRELNFNIAAIPGPSALSAAISVSGITTPFAFLGFLPRKKGEIIQTLKKMEKCALTAVFYESPKRITGTLNIIKDNFPDAKLHICKELTKINENHYHGSAEEVLSELENPEKGEYTCTISIEKKEEDTDFRELVLELSSAGISRKDIAKCMKIVYGIRKKRIFEWIS